MTREDAERRIRAVFNNYFYFAGDREADEVIEALRQEPCEDAISRKAVLDKLNRLIEVERLQGTDEMGYGRERVSAYECMIHAVESEYLYPSIQPQPKTDWIPVSEMLPKKDESVLLTICANSSLYGFNENFVKVMCGSYSPCEDKRDWIVNEIRYYIDNVIAWMPLPEPYKAESEEV